MISQTNIQRLKWKALTLARAQQFPSISIQNQTRSRVTIIHKMLLHFHGKWLIPHLTATLALLNPNHIVTWTRLSPKYNRFFRGLCGAFPPNFVKIGIVVTRQFVGPTKMKYGTRNQKYRPATRDNAYRQDIITCINYAHIRERN